MIGKLVQLMQRTGWKVRVYPIRHKRKRKIRKIGYGDGISDMFDPIINREPHGSVLWGILSVGTGLITHMVSIYNEWIFDPNYEYALPRTKESLNMSCDVNRNGYMYTGFIKIYVCIPTFKTK